MEILSLLGNSQRLDGGAMFGNAPKLLWEKLVVPDADNRILLRCRSLLVVVNGKKVLFEAGIGAFFEPRLRQRYGVQESEHVLLQSLQQAGYSHEDVDAVVLSHLHFDHAGGLLSAWKADAPPELLFPRAQYYASKTNFERAKAPHPRDRASFVPELNMLLEQSGRLRLVEEASAAVAAAEIGDWLRFHFSEGHTPGLMMAEIRVGARSGIYASDLIPGVPWVQAALTMGYDRFAERVIDEKRLVLEECHRSERVLFFTHDEQWPCGRIVRDESGRMSAKGMSIQEWLCKDEQNVAATR